MLLVVCLVETRRLIRAPFRLGNLSGGCHCNGPNTPANTFLPKQCQRSEREMKIPAVLSKLRQRGHGLAMRGYNGEGKVFILLESGI